MEVFGGLNLVFLELVCPSFLCVSRVEFCFCFPPSFFFLFFFCVFVCLLLVREFLVLEGFPCNSFVRQLLRERPAESCLNCCSCSSVAGRHCVYCCYLLLPARNNDQPFPLLLFMLLCKKYVFCFPCIHFCISFAFLVDTSGGSGLYYVI